MRVWTLGGNSFREAGIVGDKKAYIAREGPREFQTFRLLAAARTKWPSLLRTY